MKKSIYLYIYLSICLSVSLIGQSTNSQDVEKGDSIQRNTTYNLEEIKVRWKKAALENCPGVPCVVTPPAPSFTCGTSTVLDNDLNSYNTVLIGTQCWTKENLKVTTYNDGTAILLNNTYTSGTVSTVWQGLTTGAYTIYGNESSTGANAMNYGFLYNWAAAKGVSTSGSTTYKNLCPTGWHVPTDGEWTSLIQFTVPTETVSATVNGTQSPNAGGKLKSTSTLWNTAIPPSPRTDNFGFTALPGGYRDTDGSFYSVRDYAFFWSATEGGSFSAWNRYLDHYNSNVNRYNLDKSVGASVRCLRD
jgi:uncharacterized protein (TIGR02145 family)